MILGIGIDIIEVARIKASHEKFGERLLKRILRAEEIAYCFSHREPAPFLAARFAAKEAISKAFGTGIGAQLGWQDMEVRRRESGEPYVVLHDAGQALFAARNAQALHLSLSHTNVYASAVAVLEG
jgi:holo-[acyl-carrier protein] synthase